MTFVHVTVPKVIDEQSGAVTRHLQKSREEFDIDNTKLMKREEKIKEHFAVHVEEAEEFDKQEAKTRFRFQQQYVVSSM